MTIQPKVLDEVMPWKFDPRTGCKSSLDGRRGKVILTRPNDEKAKWVKDSLDLFAGARCFGTILEADGMI